ncbi:MAG: type II toxin-antitoxin system VapC family toxin [Betaproteobacteria bacterium]
MSYLVDTNVLSELRRKSPDPRVVDWFALRPAGTLFVSVLTLGEIRKGVAALPPSARRLALLDWLETSLPAFFSGRVLSVDAEIADRWGRLMASAGRPLASFDSLLVATAIRHGLTLVTRNLRDTQGLGVEVLCPWDA